MIQSMTGYAQIQRDTPHGSLALELRSVNSRFIDLAFRVAEDLRTLEPAFRELIGARIARGKVDIRLSYQLPAFAAAETSVDRAIVTRLAQLTAAVRRDFPEVQPMRVSEVLNWPGVMGDRGDLFEGLRAHGIPMMREAIDELVATRLREGAKLTEMISSRTAQIRARLVTLAPAIPAAISAYQERLAQKLRDVLSSADEDRIRQEIAVFGVKIDVAEEFTRLGAHLDEVDRALKAGGAVGKRLDFLMQELNREVNTLGSKSVSKEISEAVIEFKLAIEQMREQVQNLE